MVQIINNKETIAKVEALKKLQNTIGKIFWVGNVKHENLQFCLAAINLSSGNSGWHDPKAVRIQGLKGIYMLNQDGTLFCEARVIKENENEYLIEYLSTEGWNKFEELYLEQINS